MKPDFYLQNHKESSKVILALVFSLVGLSIYLVQRSFEIESNFSDKIISVDPEDSALSVEGVARDILMAQQGEHIGFKINFGTLSVVWPLIFFVISYIVLFLVQKQDENIKELRDCNPDFPLSRINLLTHSLPLLKGWQASLFYILSLIGLPIAGLIFHAHSGYSMMGILDLAYENASSNLLGPGHHEEGESVAIFDGIKRVFLVQTIISLVMALALFVTGVLSFRRLSKISTLLLAAKS